MLSLRGVFQMRPVADTWWHTALCAVVAIGVPEIVLLTMGRVDLAFYTSAGGLCALYGHGLPYPARARTLGWVVFGMFAGTSAGLATSAFVDSTAIRVLVIAVLAGLYKLVCDASRMGPPGNIIFTFVMTSAAFVPQRPEQLPLHMGLILAGGVLAWCVCMSPFLIRPHGPQRLAVARALESTARLLRVPAADPGLTRARHNAAVAVQAAWGALARVPAAPRRDALSNLLARAETLAATTRPEAQVTVGRAAAMPDRSGAAAFDEDGAATLDEYAVALRRGRVPLIHTGAEERSEVRGVELGRVGAVPGAGLRRVAQAFRPGALGLPLAARVAVGSALAGGISMALGVNRPYWAVMTAAVLIVANTALSWQRTVQRVLGNLVGVGLFTAVALWAHGPVALVIIALACQVIVEATISRNYWVATVFITPMALAMVEFAHPSPAPELALDRWLDTCVGAVIAVVICFVIPNRRVTDRVGEALAELETEIDHARAVIRAGTAARADRARLAAALIDVRTCADTAAGEWWSAPLPDERIVAAERTGHQLLDRLPVGRTLVAVS